MNAYEQKQEARRERLAAAADRADAKAAAAYRRADMREEVSGIPFGQPILVGHHSEGRHRRALERADNAMRASISESRKAAELRGRAAAVGTGGISADDPEAIDKLGEQIAKAEQVQDFMRQGNKLIRAACRAGVTGPGHQGFGAYLTALQALPGGAAVTVAAAAKLLDPAMFGGAGFAAFQLTNNSANIRRMKERQAQLQKAAERQPREEEIAGICRAIHNTEDNRLQLIFPGKPSAEVRGILKGRGFRWSPTAGAWQRQLTNAAIYAARCATKEIAALG